ncbi:unnamed protein product, partial [Urochloa humidicola]
LPLSLHRRRIPGGGGGPLLRQGGASSRSSLWRLPPLALVISFSNAGFPAQPAPAKSGSGSSSRSTDAFRFLPVKHRGSDGDLASPTSGGDMRHPHDLNDRESQKAETFEGLRRDWMVCFRVYLWLGRSDMCTVY